MNDAEGLRRLITEPHVEPRSAYTPCGGAPLHVALVVGHGEHIGGMETFARFLLDTVLRAGWRVTIALSGENVYDDVAFHAAPHLTIERVDWVDWTLGGDRRYHVRAIRDRRRWFRRVHPDVALFVQSSNTPFRASVVGARLAGVPVVTTHRTMPWVRDFVPKGRHFLGLVPGLGLHNHRLVLRTRFTAALADRIVYNSHAVRREYESQYRYPPRKGEVIPNAVAPPELTSEARGPSESASRPGGPDAVVTVGYVGRVAPEKRIDVLLRAVASIAAKTAVRVLIYGDGPQRSALADLARGLGIADRVEWCGVAADVWSAYERVDIVVLCSPRESSSNMVLEAMAAGKVVVVPPTGGLPELIGHGRHGVYAPVADVPALAAVLTRLAEDGEQRRRVGKLARQAVCRRHDPAVVGAAWLALLADVVQRRMAASSRAHVTPSPTLSAPQSPDNIAVRPATD